MCLTLQIDGKKYDSLYLKPHAIGGFLPFIKGESIDGYNWNFRIPDSINDITRSYSVKSYSFNLDTKTSHVMKFTGIFDKDSLFTFELVYDPVMPVIQAKYIGTHIESWPYFDGDSLYIEDALESIDSFLINFEKEDTELEVKMRNLFLGPIPQDEELYISGIIRYDSVIRRYPDSRFLIGTLAGSLGQFKSKEDINTLLNLFSEKNKNSYFGLLIKQYLSSAEFENVNLLTWDTNQMEPIIIDYSKYNLLVFSASWCRPCHEQIPLLKEIYNEKSDKLNLIYISVDEKKTIPQWQELMRKEQIPWRSLLLMEDSSKIRQKHAIQGQGIPAFLIVNPKGMVEVFKLDDKMQLYELIN